MVSKEYCQMKILDYFQVNKFGDCFLANQTQTNLSNSWWENIEKAWVFQFKLCVSSRKIVILSVNRNQTHELGWLLILQYSHNILQIFHLKVENFQKQCCNILLYKYMIKDLFQNLSNNLFIVIIKKSYNF
jgi:hypothetical protein